jgi:hypothetical protein
MENHQPGPYRIQTWTRTQASNSLNPADTADVVCYCREALGTGLRLFPFLSEESTRKNLHWHGGDSTVHFSPQTWVDSWAVCSSFTQRDLRSSGHLKTTIYDEIKLIGSQVIRDLADTCTQHVQDKPYRVLEPWVFSLYYISHLPSLRRKHIAWSASLNSPLGNTILTHLPGDMEGYLLWVGPRAEKEALCQVYTALRVGPFVIRGICGGKRCHVEFMAS